MNCYIYIGSICAESTSNVTIGDTVVASWQQWCKQLSSDSAAVLLINNEPTLQNVPLDLSKVPTFSEYGYGAYYYGRDVYSHSNLGMVPSTATYRLNRHESSLVIFTLD